MCDTTCIPITNQVTYLSFTDMATKTIHRDAIGKVYDTYDGKEIPLDSNHPITQYVNTDEILRRHIILNDKNVIGALFIGSDGRYHVISLPHVGMDGHIYGTMGTSPTQYVPIKLPEDGLKDIITLVECDDAEDLAPFKSEPINVDENETAPFTVNKRYRLIRVPKIIPLAGYHRIDGGSLDDDKVKEAIINLHPALETWVRACDGWLDSSGRNENIQSLSAGKYHNFTDLAADGSFMLHYITELDARDQPNHPIHEIEEQLEIIAEKNKREYYRMYPEHGPTQVININSNGTAVELLNNDDPIDSDKTTATMKQVRSPQALNSFRIMFATVDFTTQQVQPCALNPVAESIIRSSTSTSKLANTLRKAIDQHMLTWSNSDHFLKHSADLPYLSQLVLVLYSSGMWKEGALDDYMEMLSKELNVFMLLCPPLDSNNDDYMKMVYAGQNIKLDEAVEQNEKFCEKRSTKAFLGGRQERMEDVIGLLANAWGLSSFMVEDDHPMTFYEWVHRDFAAFLSSKPVRRWVNKFLPRAPWIPHNTIVQYHTIHSMFTELSSNFHSLMNIDQNIMPSFDKYLAIRDHYYKVKEVILLGVQQSSLGHFISPAGSYNFFKHEELDDCKKTTTNKRGGNFDNSARKKQSSGMKWLRYTGQGLPKFPILKHGRICKSYAVQGFTCNRGERCRFGGHVHFSKLKPEDKDIMRKWIDESNDLFFLEG